MAKKKHAANQGGPKPAKSILEEQRRLLEEAAKNVKARVHILQPADVSAESKVRSSTSAGSWLGVCCRRRSATNDAGASHQHGALDEVSEKPGMPSPPCGQAVSLPRRATPVPCDVFGVRCIDFCGRRVQILMQGRNGPCSLLAVANCLLLRGALDLGADCEFCTSDQLVQQLSTLGQSLNSENMVKDKNAAETVKCVLDRLPVLLDGLMLNCKFTGCMDFEYYGDLDLFDVFGLRLYHIWMQPEVGKIVDSWNVLEERLVACSELRSSLEMDGRSPTPEEADLLTVGLWLEEWCEETRTQATLHGLEDLYAKMQDGSVGVLFRNNHFSCIYKPPGKQFCALLADAAFQDLPSALWESVELAGAATIFDARFQPYTPEEDYEAFVEESKSSAGKSHRSKTTRKRR